MIGAHVEGFAAHVVDRILAGQLPKYLGAMSARQRGEVERARREIRAAADHWQRNSSVNGTAEPDLAELGAGSGVDEISVAQAVDLLGCTDRWVRRLAAGWEEQGLARKVGRSWLLDRVAVLAQVDEAGRRSA